MPKLSPKKNKRNSTEKARSKKRRSSAEQPIENPEQSCEPYDELSAAAVGECRITDDDDLRTWIEHRQGELETYRHVFRGFGDDEVADKSGLVLWALRKLREALEGSAYHV